MPRRSVWPLVTAEECLDVRREACMACGGRLHVVHRARRTVRRLDGVWRLTLTLRRCDNTTCPEQRALCRPEDEGAWALPGGEFGFDVLALVGTLRYAEHRSIPEIHGALRARGVTVAERTVTHLLARYDELLALRLTDVEALRTRFAAQGRVILALDGLKPDVGHEVLWVARDCLSGDVLLARALLSEAREELAALLGELRATLPVPVAGVVSDGQAGIRLAVAEVFPDVPHQLCQYHYLREAARPIHEADRHAKKQLKALVRDIRPTERLMEAACTGVPPATPAYLRALSPAAAETMLGYCQAVRSALTDDGQPPLCAAGLRLRERLTAIADSLARAIAAVGSGVEDDWRLTFALERVLRPLRAALDRTEDDWPAIRAAYARVLAATRVLNNEDGVSATMVRVRFARVLNEMRAALAAPDTEEAEHSWYTTFLKVTASYGDALFRCYDHPGPGLPRTNNDLEQCFGSLRYHERRASGRKQVHASLLLRGRARVLASLATRLHGCRPEDLPPEDQSRWRTLRRDLEARQETRRQQRRFRRDPEGYLRALERRCTLARCGIV